MDKDIIIYDDKYYNNISPKQRFLDDIRLNPNNVSIPPCYLKTSILKITSIRRILKECGVILIYSQAILYLNL
jgi:hypothetical protein